MDNRVEVEAGQVRIIGPRGLIDEAALADVERLYFAYPLRTFYHGAVAYYLSLFPDRLWVLPFFTTNLGAFVSAVAPALEARGALFDAHVPRCPRVWRRRLLGLFPLSPAPHLGSHPLRTLPALVQVKPVPASEMVCQ